MKTLSVNLGDRSYPIYIGANLLAKKALLKKHIKGGKCLIVTNETIAPLYLDALIETLGEQAHDICILPDGEQYKNTDTLQTIYNHLIDNRHDRQTTLIALGGGVIGDITGFAAATYQRGVNFIQIPTTLLAQVDSSVGGKTGINHPGGKNMIGAFYQPQCVIADINTLNTLDDRQLSAGLAEVIKYGLIHDAAFFTWLESNMQSLLQKDADALIQAIETSCQTKADMVAADEREAGIRALLNLGHTFGHAIETTMGYGEWLHGEAVAAGMCLAATLSHQLQWISDDALARTIHLIKAANLPTTPPETMSIQQFKDIMSIDKKVQDGVIRLVLQKDIGKAVISGDHPDSALTATFKCYGLS